MLIGNWDENKKVLACRTMSLFPKTRLSNLFGKALKSSSFEYKPYTYIVEGEGDDEDGPVYDGVEVNIHFESLIACFKYQLLIIIVDKSHRHHDLFFF